MGFDLKMIELCSVLLVLQNILKVKQKTVHCV